MKVYFSKLNLYLRTILYPSRNLVHTSYVSNDMLWKYMNNSYIKHLEIISKTNILILWLPTEEYRITSQKSFYSLKRK